MIEDYSFGMIVIEGTKYTKDIKIIDGKVVSDWWRDRGHRVTESDVSDIMAVKPDVLVLGKGQPGKMKSSSSLRKNLRENSIELIEEETAQAILTFNQLHRDGENVAAGFHLTC
jgi:hypothetical protein